MDRLEVVPQAIGPSNDGHRDDQGGDAGENGTGHEVGTEDRAMPHGPQGQGEDPRDHGVDGNGDGDDGDGEHRDDSLKDVAGLVVVLVSDGEEPVEPSRPDTEVAHHREVRDHGDVEVDAAGREVEPDAEDVPEQGRPWLSVEDDVSALRHSALAIRRMAEINVPA